MNDIGQLHEAIRRLHGCNALHNFTIPIKKTFQDQVIWEGEIGVFVIWQDRQAKTVYAWSYKQDDGQERFVAVLKEPPINRPVDAVRAFIASEYKTARVD